MERIVYYQPPPLCFAKQNIGEVSRSDGGVEKTRLCLFILLNSEKNEPRSSGSYRAIRLVATVAVGVCGTRFARTVLALFPPSPLRLHRPIKADRGLCICLYSNPLALRALPLYSLTETQGERRVNSITSIAGFFKPSPHRYTPQLSPIFCVIKHPVGLWDTAGEE